MSIVRILKIPRNSKEDNEGRKLGDDWLLATIGQDDEGNEYYITTDNLKASESLPIFEPANFSNFVVDKINEEYAKQNKKPI